MPVSLRVNGRTHTIESDPATPLLWVLRDELNLTGVKYGCGISRCGACTVHVAGEPVRSCTMSVSEVGDLEVVTIEGLSADGSHRVQRAWVAEEVPQCGYCQTGQVMAAAALLSSNPSPSDADIDRAMVRNLCRCGTYGRIRAAIHRAAREG
jgi:aerobic-type carbon monoxide dehydrogenase small subunit (CoxS/CutS family)